MKKILRFSCIYLCFISICFGQVTDVVSDLSSPNGLLIDQGKLYIAESGKDRVVSVLLESTQVNLTEVATDVLFPIGLEKYMNQLLISENDGGRLLKKDLSTTSTSTEIFLNFESPTTDPYGLLVANDILYASGVNGLLFEIDLTADQLTAEPLIPQSDGTILSLELKNNFLYYTESEREGSMFGGLYKIDVSSPNPAPVRVIDNLDAPVGLAIDGNDLYFSEPDLNKIFKIDISESNPVPVEVLSDLNEPITLYIDQGILYISKQDKVSKVALATLMVTSVVEPKITLYPNPTSHRLTLEGLQSDFPYAIYNLSGKKVEQGVSLNQNIEVSHFAAGVYVLKVNRKTILKFIKL
jgi:hypothetical protein